LDSKGALTSNDTFTLESLEFWVAPLLGGSPRRLGNLMATHRDWLVSGTGFPTPRRYGEWPEQQSAAGLVPGWSATGLCPGHGVAPGAQRRDRGPQAGHICGLPLFRTLVARWPPPASLRFRPWRYGSVPVGGFR